MLLSIIERVRTVVAEKYLPGPFMYAKSETLMDWYNLADWANNPGEAGVVGAGLAGR